MFDVDKLKHYSRFQSFVSQIKEQNEKDKMSSNTRAICTYRHGRVREVNGEVIRQASNPLTKERSLSLYSTHFQKLLHYNKEVGKEPWSSGYG